MMVVCVMLLSGCVSRLFASKSVSPATSQQASAASAVEKATATPIDYTVRFDAPSDLRSELEKNSQLAWLASEPPRNRVGLERRALEDVSTATKILHSHGYYDGVVRHTIDWNTSPVQVRFIIRPRKQYTLGTTLVHYEMPDQTAAVQAQEASTVVASPETTASEDAPKAVSALPTNLDSVGLKVGQPAEAEEVLAVNQRLINRLHEEGYPLASIAGTQYILDRFTRTLEVTLTVSTGQRLRMGQVVAQEENMASAIQRAAEGHPLEARSPEAATAVSEVYLNQLTPWQQGQWWDARQIRAYRTALQETGLFSFIDLEPDSRMRDADGNTPILLTVKDAPFRTISGGMQYATDMGFGVRGTWEHRNLFGGGEQLRVVAPLSQDSQQLQASFRKQAFGDKNQALVAEAEARNETLDAYEQSAIYGAAGLERRLSGAWKHWWSSARVSFEGGSLNDNNGRQTYSLVGLPLSLRRDTTNDLLNPTEGTRLALTLTPYTGSYHGALSTVRGRVDASAYVTPFDTNRFVVALRSAVGSLAAGSVNDIPATVRFYAGGGGSVRGYAYQSLGPHDAQDDPVGGLSFTDVGLEFRCKITESFGIVPFVDGGMVYEESTPQWGKDMAWGVGLGFRYYTVIGPIRLDVATPLQDRKGNKPFQIYLSIGQAF